MNTKVVLGKDKDNKPFEYDIKYMPHLLMAGNTGSGKEQFLHNLILQLMNQNTPDEIKFILFDCNRVELVHYSYISYLYAPVQTIGEIGKDLFEWLDYEQDRRYKVFSKDRVHGIDDLNSKAGKVIMPRIIVVVNELAHLLAENTDLVEKYIVRVTQLSKLSGIHMILSTQIASKSAVTGLIKANIPARISFKTSAEVHSMWIIDQPGAEKLTGKGDMLFVPPDSARPILLQASDISDKEIFERVEKYKVNEPQYNEVLMFALRNQGDAIFENNLEKAKEIIIREQKVSTALIQRELCIGYAQTARIIDLLEKQGIIGPYDSETHTRKVLI